MPARLENSLPYVTLMVFCASDCTSFSQMIPLFGSSVTEYVLPVRLITTDVLSDMLSILKILDVDIVGSPTVWLTSLMCAILEEPGAPCCAS